MECYSKINLVLLVNSLNCGIGGMEVHQRAFIAHFRFSTFYHLFVMAKDHSGLILYDFEGESSKIMGSFAILKNGLQYFHRIMPEVEIFFANDFWWIDNLPIVQELFPMSKIYIRSGGNDIEKMPWNKGDLSYEERLFKCKDTLNSIEGIIVNSLFSKNRFVSHGILSNKLSIIRGGVDYEACYKASSSKLSLRQDIRATLQINKPLIFSFACRLVPFKGIELALDAIKHSTCHENCHVLFMGDGELKDTIEKDCVAKGISHSLLGSLPNEQVLQIIGSSNLLFNTSIDTIKSYRGTEYIHTETMGRTMMEAISVRTPIIATKVGGIPELFEENEDIGIMTTCNVSEISTAIEKALCHNFTFKIKKDYSWDYVFNIYSILFKK